MKPQKIVILFFGLAALMSAFLLITPSAPEIVIYTPDIDEESVVYDGNLAHELSLSKPLEKVLTVRLVRGNFELSAGKDYAVKEHQVYPTSGGQLSALPAGTKLSVRYLAIPPSPEKNFDYEINHILSYGQSLSAGIRATVDYAKGDFRVLPHSNNYDALMFNGGVRPQLLEDADLEKVFQSFVPLQEDNTGRGPGNGPILSPKVGETPLSGMAEMLNALLDKENGPEAVFQILASCPGNDGNTIDSLSKAREQYNKLIYEVKQGVRLAKKDGKSYGVPAILWLQGEADGLNMNYQAVLNQLFNDLNRDVKAITSQTKDVQFIIYQTAISNIPAYAQFELHRSRADVTIAAPVYWLAKSDGTHLTALSSRLLGAYFGRAIKRIVIDNIKFKPLKITKASIKNDRIVVSLNNSSGLIFDTIQVPAKSGYGFYLTDGEGNQVNVAKTSLSSANTLTLTPERVSHGYTLHYDSGNIRDEAGLTDRIRIEGVVYPLHNWLTTSKWLLE